MSEHGRHEGSVPSPETGDRQGPNLALLYTLIGLALAAAIGIATAIVLPFYHRR